MGRSDPNQDVDYRSPKAILCHETTDALERELQKRYKRSRYPQSYRDLLYALWVEARRAQYEYYNNRDIPANSTRRS